MRIETQRQLQRDRAEALAEFESCKGIDFDADIDNGEKQKYYSGIDRTLPPQELFNSLHDLVKRTHLHELPYRPGVHLYPAVDVRPNGKLCSVYGRQTCYDPREKIIEAFKIEEQRLQWIASRGGDPLAMSDIDLEALDAEFPYNCEHVVCQSWFKGGDRAGVGDLHHLFCCDAPCNNGRNDNLLVDQVLSPTKCRPDCGCWDGTKFAPESGKAQAARATLYFLIRYPKQISRNSPFDRNALDIMLQWHEAEAPSQSELHRNMHIHRKQGNRNPLIDFPGLASRIDLAVGI